MLPCSRAPGYLSSWWDVKRMPGAPGLHQVQKDPVGVNDPSRTVVALPRSGCVKALAPGSIPPPVSPAVCRLRTGSGQWFSKCPGMYHI